MNRGGLRGSGASEEKRWETGGGGVLRGPGGSRRIGGMGGVGLVHPPQVSARCGELGRGHGVRVAGGRDTANVCV